MVAAGLPRFVPGFDDKELLRRIGQYLLDWAVALLLLCTYLPIDPTEQEDLFRLSGPRIDFGELPKLVGWSIVCAAR